ncbi:MAG: hypothetical protein WAM14_24020 [Candidatus Nitrosopolaris sp.]
MNYEITSDTSSKYDVRTFNLFLAEDVVYLYDRSNVRSPQTAAPIGNTIATTISKAFLRSLGALV